MHSRRRVLSAALAGKRTPIKAALLDQKVVAGLGNIYVCEALFRARISPRSARRTRVPGARAARLVPAIKDDAAEAIAAGGSSLRDYVQPDGELGYFQHAWKVYGREGERLRALPRAALLPRHPPHHAVRPQHVLLPAHAAVATSRRNSEESDMADDYRTSSWSKRTAGSA